MNSDELARALEDAIDRKMDKVPEALTRAMLKVRDIAQNHHIAGNERGVIRSAGDESINNSLEIEVKKEGDGVSGKLLCKSKHAIFVEFGTGSVGEASGGNGSTKRVTYTKRQEWTYPVEGYNGVEFYVTSGQPARPFMFPAFEEAKSIVPQIMLQALK